MNNQHRILFYGNSLVLAGVQATFKGYPGFETIALDQPTTQTELLILDPTVVVLDMGGPDFDFLLAQMHELPGLLVIGIDPESHEVLLTGQAACSITPYQISEIVRNWVRPKDVNPHSSSPQAHGQSTSTE